MSAAAGAQQRAREYETIYVLRQDADADAADKVAGRVAEVVSRENGKLVKVESWGRRRLAYEVAKQRRGVYYYLKYLGGGRLVTELERNLRMLDTVLKFQTVLLREDIEVETVAIDPEEVKFARLEPPAEEEKDESPERALGLIDQPEHAPRSAEEFVDGHGPTAEEVPDEEAVEEKEEKVVMSQRNMDFGDDKDFGRTPDLNADAPGRRRGARKRVCKFCADKAITIDYKDPQALKYFVSERGKVVPRRISGNCARHQRRVTLAIKRARTIALLPFTVTS